MTFIPPQIAQKQLKVLVVGDQHAGKSSLINTLSKHNNPNLKVEMCDIGRTAEVGTLLYESVSVHSSLMLFDSAGKPFERPDDLKNLKIILKGIKTGTNLLEDDLSNMIDEENRIDGVIFVCRACDWNSDSLKRFVKFQNAVKETDEKGLPFNPMIILTHFTQGMSEREYTDKVPNAIPFAFIDNPKDLTKELTQKVKDACNRITRQFKTWSLF